MTHGTGGPTEVLLDPDRLPVHHAVVPAGLDGHADPIRTDARDAVLDQVARRIVTSGAGRVCVGIDGLFLHRSELAPHWHASVLLTADARLDAAWTAYLLDDLPAGATEQAEELDQRLHRARWPRYRDGWARYVAGNDPGAAATIVVDNEHHRAPVLLRI